MSKSPQERLKQADYDMDTVEIMFYNKRHIYAVFMCHLSREKALKGLYTQKLNKTPPKTHNLIFLVEKIKLELSDMAGKVLPQTNRNTFETTDFADGKGKM